VLVFAFHNSTIHILIFIRVIHSLGFTLIIRVFSIPAEQTINFTTKRRIWLGHKSSSGSLTLYSRVGRSGIDGFTIRSSYGVVGSSAVPRLITLVTGLSMLLPMFRLSFTKSTSVALSSSSAFIITVFFGKSITT